MYGVSIDGSTPVIVLEYCEGGSFKPNKNSSITVLKILYVLFLCSGSLDKLLFDKREHISNEKKLEWLQGIAAGMCHLHKFNIVHRDLASRNILLTHYQKNSTPKISVCILELTKTTTSPFSVVLNNYLPLSEGFRNVSSIDIN
jgi:serine/threonine protein kinase